MLGLWATKGLEYGIRIGAKGSVSTSISLSQPSIHADLESSDHVVKSDSGSGKNSDSLYIKTLHNDLFRGLQKTHDRSGIISSKVKHRR